MELISFGPVSLIPGKKGSKFPYCNSLFIEEAGVIIDPSSNRRIIEGLYGQNKVRTVCLTHWHEDHFRYLHLLDDCALWISELDSAPLGDSNEFLKWYGLAEPELAPLRHMIQTRMDSEIHFKPRVPTRILTDGDIIDLGSVSMEAVATPGHSPGHLSFFFRELSLLFLGDYNLDPFGPWTGDPFSDIDQCLESIKRLRRIPADILITGHHPEPIRGVAPQRWDQYVNTISIREQKILDFLGQPRSLNEIIDQWIILEKPKEPVIYFRCGEKAHVEKHLARMIRQGVIELTDHLYHIT